MQAADRYDHRTTAKKASNDTSWSEDEDGEEREASAA